jgi:DNA repair exonuclease SbcCD ATPase subunit
MIHIKELTVKNFMSVGNQTQAVNFEREQLTLVLGENLDQGGDDSGSRNGTGKTTIVNALSFALYGQALTNIKKDNLINKINNKNMLVTLTFNKDGLTIALNVDVSPTVMKFFVNNQEQASEITDDSQGDMRETQKDLDELLGMSHDMFRHILL